MRTAARAWERSAAPADRATARTAGAGAGLRRQRVTARTADVVAGAVPAGGEPAAGLGTDDVPGWAARALEQLLTVTYWLDPGEHGEPFAATIRFTGHRTDAAGGLGPATRSRMRRPSRGSCPEAGRGGHRGGARCQRGHLGGDGAAGHPRRGRAGPARTADRASHRRAGAVAAAGADPGQPRRDDADELAAAVEGARIIRYAYACLVVLGVLTGLGLEGLLLATGHYPLLRPLLLSAAAVAAGVIGGKTWYAAMHRGRKWDGWCIQGFVAGAAVVVAVVALAGPGLPAGAFLAAATPALLIGMGIGRHGCFWARCCTGRATASRWGIWSSDRRLGCRRMPVQLLEAWTALAVGAGSLAAVLAEGLSRSGPVAVAGLAAYTLVRQLILGLRDEPRQWRDGRRVTAALAAIALIAGVALFAG